MAAVSNELKSSRERIVHKEDQGSGTREDQGSGTREDQGSGTREDQGSGTQEDQGRGTREDQGSGTREDQGSGTREDQGSGTWELYLQRRRLIQQFLRSSLSLRYLQKQEDKVHILKRCSFYLDVEPKYVNVTDQNHEIHRTETLQLIDHQRLQRVRKMGKIQTQIQLLLLTELLKQLQQGWEELNSYVEVCDMATFFAQWDGIRQKLSKLTGFMETLLSLEFPGKICVKHSLVSHADLTGTRPPSIRFSLYTKMPVVFDRKESFALENWARLKWFTENQESHLEQCELSFKLLTIGVEVGFGRTHQVSSNSRIVQNLKPGRSYEFTIRRLPKQTLVLEEWRDTIVLTTGTAEDVQSSACAPEG